MDGRPIVIIIISFALSMVLTGVVRHVAISRGLLDFPNSRSSHSTPTPRGGGLAIVLATAGAVLALMQMRLVSHGLAVAVVGGGGLVATIGFVDDRRSIHPSIRLLIHIVSSAWAVAWVGSPSTVLLGHYAFHLGWIGPALAVLGIAWVLNLFNFMDGIDGIAASEAVFVAAAGAWFALCCGGSREVWGVSLVFGAACAGFLVWNWPPAKIFMGDVGSGYLGYVIGVLALTAVRESAAALWVWLILGGTFFVDASVTLVRRAIRGDRIYEAHRSHGYQWLARRWRRHKSVTICAVAVNLFWLLPWACLGAMYPSMAAWFALLALIPLTVGALASGAGRRERD